MQMRPCLRWGRWWWVGKEPGKASFEVLMVPGGRDPQLVRFPHGEPHRWGSYRSPGAQRSCVRDKVGGRICFLVPCPKWPPSMPCCLQHDGRSSELVLHPALPGWAGWSTAEVLQYSAVQHNPAAQLLNLRFWVLTVCCNFLDIRASENEALSGRV